MTVRSSLTNQVALITGASSGIGLETAKLLAADGVSVALAARSEEKLEQVATELSSEFDIDAIAIQTDVSDEQAVSQMVETTCEELGSIDIVVANAGTAYDNVIEDVTIEEYRTVMGVNVDGVFFTVKETLPLLRESQGSLVVIGSYAAHVPYPGNPIYGASKWWVRGFVKSVAAVAGPDGVAVTIINPSEVRTEFNFGEDDPTAYHERFEPGDVTEPESIAEAVRFAAAQETPDAVFELDLFRRDKFDSP